MSVEPEQSSPSLTIKNCTQCEYSLNLVASMRFPINVSLDYRIASHFSTCRIQCQRHFFEKRRTRKRKTIR